jgi:pimeloyl-ACP methyl ester carboxylesterase
MSSLEINEVKLFWEDKGAGQPVLFVPGSNGDYRAWTNQLEYFSKTCRVITMSRRYQFPSQFEKNGSSTIEENCNDIFQLLLHLNLNKITWFIHDLGGLRYI